MQVLRQLAAPCSDNLIVGATTADDAAVHAFPAGRALVLTADFITPVHDDPRVWGRIAVANCLSDVYAMGGRPLVALNLVGFPRDKLPLEVLQQVLRGAEEKADEAGVCIGGGHTLDAPEPFYGMAVAGEVAGEGIVTNAGVRPGDALVLTKALGVGIIVTAMIADMAEAEAVEAAVTVMERLNRTAAEAMTSRNAHAATDVTGFGLVGHAREMAAASGVSLRISVERVPVIPQAVEYANQWVFPESLLRNREFYRQWSNIDEVPFALASIFCDPQTSGGLLIAAEPGDAEKMVEDVRSRGEEAWIIGEAGEDRPGMVIFQH